MEKTDCFQSLSETGSLTLKTGKASGLNPAARSLSRAVSSAAAGQSPVLQTSSIKRQRLIVVPSSNYSTLGSTYIRAEENSHTQGFLMNERMQDRGTY